MLLLVLLSSKPVPIIPVQINTNLLGCTILLVVVHMTVLVKLSHVSSVGPMLINLLVPIDVDNWNEHNNRISKYFKSFSVFLHILEQKSHHEVLNLSQTCQLTSTVHSIQHDSGSLLSLCLPIVTMQIQTEDESVLSVVFIGLTDVELVDDFRKFVDHLEH